MGSMTIKRKTEEPFLFDLRPPPLRPYSPFAAREKSPFCRNINFAGNPCNEQPNKPPRFVRALWDLLILSRSAHSSEHPSYCLGPWLVDHLCKICVQGNAHVLTGHEMADVPGSLPCFLSCRLDGYIKDASLGRVLSRHTKTCIGRQKWSFTKLSTSYCYG